MPVQRFSGPIDATYAEMQDELEHFNEATAMVTEGEMTSEELQRAILIVYHAAKTIEQIADQTVNTIADRLKQGPLQFQDIPLLCAQLRKDILNELSALGINTLPSEDKAIIQIASAIASFLVKNMEDTRLKTWALRQETDRRRGEFSGRDPLTGTIEYTDEIHRELSTVFLTVKAEP